MSHTIENKREKLSRKLLPELPSFLLKTGVLAVEEEEEAAAIAAKERRNKQAKENNLEKAKKYLIENES